MDELVLLIHLRDEGPVTKPQLITLLEESANSDEDIAEFTDKLAELVNMELVTREFSLGKYVYTLSKQGERHLQRELG